MPTKPPDFVIIAGELGLSPSTRRRLQQSKTGDHKEATMAAAGHCYGLRVWLSGTTAALIDERGFVCSTTDVGELMLCLRFESILGPGALRALLAKPVIDPMAAVQLFQSRFSFKLPPEHKGGESANARRSISREVFKSMLDKI